MRMDRQKRTRTTAIILVALVGLTARTPAAQPKKPVKPEPPKATEPAPNPQPIKPILTSPSSWTPDMSFERAIDILRHSTAPPLNVIVLWRDLASNADVDKDTPIGIDGIAGVPLKVHLKLLLLSISATATEKVSYTVDHGTIIIGTVNAMPRRRVTRIYDVSDLAAPPARYFLPMVGAMGMGTLLPTGPMGGYGGMMGGYGGYQPGYGQTGLSNVINTVVAPTR